MSLIFKHVEEGHRLTETLTMRTCGQGVYIGVNSYRVMPVDIDDEEQTTSIVVPFDKVGELANSLTKVATTWTKPSDKLPDHLQDCIVCRIVDSQCRVSQSHYFKGENVKGFFDLDDGESFYDDAEILYWMPVYMTDIYRELDQLNGVT